MDKRKLVNIIVKDLDELKILAEEVADSQDNSSLIIDLAVNKARLLIQEIEVLREIAVNSVLLQPVVGDDLEDADLEDEEEVSDLNFPDPELEILHFEEGEFPENEDLPEEVDEEEFEEDEVQEEDEPELDENEEDDLKSVAEIEFDDEDELENAEEEELEEEELAETAEEDLEEEDTVEEEADDEEAELEDEEKVEEEPLQKTNIQVTELGNSPQPGIREIHIDEFDDDDELEPINFEPIPAASVKPTMHEVPKPDNTAVGQNYHKERSLNDSMGENKQESKLSSGPINSLRAAIGLNDRFLFIREIFNNNSEKYNEIIERLDKMEQIQEAVEYLKANLSMEKNETTMKFVDLLKRRFTKP